MIKFIWLFYQLQYFIFQIKRAIDLKIGNIFEINREEKLKLFAYACIPRRATVLETDQSRERFARAERSLVVDSLSQGGLIPT